MPAGLLLFLGELVVQGAHQLVDPGAVPQRGVAVGPLPADRVAFGHYLRGILTQEPLQYRLLADVDAVLVAAEREWMLGIEAAEVKERQRPAVDHIAPAAVLEPPAVQVPVGHVVLGISNDRQIGQEARRQVEPTLVHEVAPHGVHAAVAPQPVAPPVE